MTRPAPGSLPGTLPDNEAAALSVERSLRCPRARLADLSIRQLVEEFGDGTPVWVTGSTTWLPAVFGHEPDLDSDVDLVFSTQSARERFVKGVLATLNTRIPGFTYEKSSTAFGADRIMFPSSTHGLPSALVTRHGHWGHLGQIVDDAKKRSVIEAWHLEPGTSIAEVLMSYLSDYQRTAYLVSRSITGGGCLTRLVREAKRPMSSRYSR